MEQPDDVTESGLRPGWTAVPRPEPEREPEPAAPAESTLPPPPQPVAPDVLATLPPPPAAPRRPAPPAGPAPVAAPPLPHRDLPIANILLIIGTGLVVVAAAIFTAVNWSEMGARLQGLVLVLFTIVAVACTRLARVKGLTATAEALGVVSLAALAADSHALRIGLIQGPDVQLYWAAALAVLTAVAWLGARAFEIRSPRYVAVIVGQAPLALLAGGLGWTDGWAVSAMLVQVAVVAAWCARDRSVAPSVRITAGTLAGAWWAGMTAAAASGAGDADLVADHRQAYIWAAVLVLSALVALEVAVLWRHIPAARAVALTAAMAPFYGAVGVVVICGVTEHWRLLALAAAALVVGTAALALPRDWRVEPAAVSGVVFLGASWPVVIAAGAMIDAAGRAAGELWSSNAAVTATSFIDPLRTIPESLVLTLQVGLLILAVGVLWPVAGRRRTLMAAAGVFVLAVLVAPVMGSLNIGATAAVLCAAMVLAAAVPLLPLPEAVVPEGRWEASLTLPSLFAVGWGLLAGLWAASSRGTTLGVALAVAAAAGLVVVAARPRQEATLALFGSLVVGGALATAGITAAVTTGMAAPTAVNAGFLSAAAVMLVVIQLLDARGTAGGIDATICWSLIGVAGLVHLVALQRAAGETNQAFLAIALVSGAVVWGVSAIGANRRLFAVVAAVETLAFIWLEMAQQDIHVIEAYTVPPALVLLGVGYVADRRSRRAEGGELLPSWLAYGTGLLLGFAPTVVVGVQQDGVLRPSLGIVAGGALLAFGAWRGVRAAVDVGMLTVVILGLDTLLPRVGDLPNWASIGATGAVLVALGARFEAVRREMGTVRRFYAELH